MDFDPHLMRWLDESLGGPRCRTAAYLSRNSANHVKCSLCGTDYMINNNGLKQHLGSVKHRKRYERLEALQRQVPIDTARLRRIKAVQELNSRIASLGLPKWKVEVKTLLFDYVQSDAGQSSELIHAVCVLEKNEALMELLSLS